MQPLSHEQTINTALGEVLESLGRRWQIRAEDIAEVFEGGGRPDILIEKNDGWAIVIEAEVANHKQAEVEAQARLYRTLCSTGKDVHVSIALVYPSSLRRFHGKNLRTALTTTRFEYVVFVAETETQHSRFPAMGWMSGDIKELSLILHRSTVPNSRVERLVNVLEDGIVHAYGTLSNAHPHRSMLGEQIAEILGQSDDAEGQTRRMAMTVIINALVFHSALANAGMELPATPKRAVRNPSYFRYEGAFRPTDLLDEWGLILRVNYWPIFHTSRLILNELPTRLAANLLDILWRTAEDLIVGGVTTSHDLTGVVFQRLITDRKFLATFYTRPASAELLAGLAIPLHGQFEDCDWSDHESVAQLRIADFACGTGTLLSRAYQRVGLIHELCGGDSANLHPLMMSRGLVGLDVLTVAVHLTAAMLAGVHPKTPFDGECLLTMPYGCYKWGVSLGSLDLLLDQWSLLFAIFEAAAETAGGRGPKEVRDLMSRIGHEQFNLVIMNPPFTRHGAREGDRSQVHNPAFAAFGASEDDQKRLAKQLKKLSAGGPGHGHAGLATYFVDLAHRKLAAHGRLALVLPITALSGDSWEKVRQLWRRDYSRLLVVSIAQSGSQTQSFSADTKIAECLIVGTKTAPDTGTPRATFVVLSNRPKDTITGEQVAGAITSCIDEGGMRTLEAGPYGGTRIVLGETAYGELIDCPLPDQGAWQIASMRDISLAQTAYQLTNGCLWVEGMDASETISIPIAPIGKISRGLGPHHLDLSGKEKKADGLPQGPYEILKNCPVGAAYPCLWNHNASAERTLLVHPDSHCRIREINGVVPKTLADRATKRWATSRRLHYSCDVGFKSHSVIACMTKIRSIGGRAWPTVLMNNEEDEYPFVIWCNSTLGLLCHWWMSSKTQPGRGISTVNSIPLFPTLNVQRLSQRSRRISRDVFDELSELRLLPFDQIDEDRARAKLDKLLIEEILELPKTLCEKGGPLDRLRVKLANEPHIHAAKKSRLAFTDEGEQRLPR